MDTLAESGSLDEQEAELRSMAKWHKRAGWFCLTVSAVVAGTGIAGAAGALPLNEVGVDVMGACQFVAGLAFLVDAREASREAEELVA